MAKSSVVIKVTFVFISLMVDSYTRNSISDKIVLLIHSITSGSDAVNQKSHW